jgi:hypothetical protein
MNGLVLFRRYTQSLDTLGLSVLIAFSLFIGIAYNNDPNATHGRTITSSNAYHKAIEWFLHHMNDLVLFRKYTRSLDILELSVLIAFLLLITIKEVRMLKSKTSLLGVNNVIK